MYKLITNCPELYDELFLEVIPFNSQSDEEITIRHFFSAERDKYINRIQAGDKSKDYYEPAYNGSDALICARLFKRAAKRAIYRFLSELTGKSLPWGSLTGIRPTHIAYEFLSDGGNFEEIPEYMIKNFDVSPKRAELTRDIIGAQSKYYFRDSKSVNFYIHIPFCPSRCAYCSFTSLVYEKARKFIEPYLDVLIDEINYSARIIEENGLRVDSIYIGGGTPTSLESEDLKRLLKAVPFRGVEFTLEAGRPDTITAEKLNICSDEGVTRISVNPQSLDETVLKNIGRNHSNNEFYAAFDMVKKLGFVINTDLIAGLPGQTLSSFKNDISAINELKPQNITVHTLSYKNGTELKNNGRAPENSVTEEMMDFAIDCLTKNGYLPYYLYRQKNMVGNLENIGFSLDGFQCRNNVTTMEECLSVMACGAGAIGKRVFSGGRIERLANLRDVKLYIENGRERFPKKRIFYSNQFTF